MQPTVRTPRLRSARGAIALAALLGALIAATDASALSEIEKRGRVLAVRLCAQCHAIGKNDASPRVTAPPFRRLEQRLNLDTFASRLRQGLMTGHYDMPEFRFSREDARALVAYLRTIQGP
jgi:cytochrome c